MLLGTIREASIETTPELSGHGIALLGVSAALLVLPWAVPNLYIQHIAILVFMYIALASSWNIIGGYAGYESFGHIVFFGIGAYTAAILLIQLGWSPLLTAPVAGAAAALSAVAALPSLRTRGAYFAIATLALAFLGQVLISNLDSLTGGGRGLFLPLPPWDLSTAKRLFYYAMLIGAVGSVAMSILIKRSKFGLGLELIRDDEDKAEAIGINTTYYKGLAFVLSAFFPGYVGAVHAYQMNYISPANTFSILISINILLFAIFGGKGTVAGPVLGATVLVLLSQFLNIALTGELHVLLFGLLLIGIVLFVPEGIIFLLLRRRIQRPLLQDTTPVQSLRGIPGDLSVPAAQPRSPALGGNAPVLELQEVSKCFGGIKALDRCSFAVRDGTITGLIGPNGSGKSTAINIITGYYTCDAGMIVYRARICNGLRPHRVKRLGIARSFQETRVFSRLTVLENIVGSVSGRAGLGLLQPRLSAHEVKKALELLEFVGLLDLRGVPAGELSYGQQKLLEFASVVMADPDLILLDEPAAGVNPVVAERIMAFIRLLNSQGKTFLLIEHDMAIIMNLCDPVIVMDAGRPVAQGSPTVIQRDPRVLEAYLGVG